MFKNRKLLEEANEKINSLSSSLNESKDIVNLLNTNIKELRKLYKIKEPFMVSLIKNHKTLYGKPLMEMVKWSKKIKTKQL